MSVLFGGNRAATVKAPTRLNGLRLTQSILGTAIPILIGTDRLQGRVIWYDDWKAIPQYQKVSGGKGFGGGKSVQSITGYQYQASILELLCHGRVNGLLNVWDTSGKFFAFVTTETHTVAGGGDSYTPTRHTNYNSDFGVGRQVTYSKAVTDYGSPGLVNYSGSYYQGMTSAGATTTPPAGQYGLVNGVYYFNAADAGASVQITYAYNQFLIGTSETGVVPGTPFQITVSQTANFNADLGVSYYPSGTALVKVASAPVVGQYAVNSVGVYTFAAADAGQGIRITYNYNDTSPSQTAISVLNLTLITGAVGQAAWSYLTSNHPDKALGYSGLALLGSAPFQLGQGGETPNFSYEIVGPYVWGNGIQDAHPVDGLYNLLTNATWGAQFPTAWIDNWYATGTGTAGNKSVYSYWAANGYFVSMALDQQVTVSDILKTVIEAGNAGMYWSEGLLKLKPYGDTTTFGNGYEFDPPTQPVFDLDDNDFLPMGQNEDPVQVSRKAWQDAYNKVTVEFEDRANSYNPQPVQEQDDAKINRFGLRSESVQAWHFIKTLSTATWAANLRLKRYTNIWATYRFRLGWTYAGIEPMDLLTITDANLGYVKIPVRIVEVTENPDGSMDVTAEEFPWSTAAATLYPKQANNPFIPSAAQADPGNTNAIVLESTSRANLQQGNVAYILANGSNPNWGGCDVYVSRDNTTYSYLATIKNPARTGTLAAGLANTADPDNTNTLSVNMAPGATLGAVTAADKDALVTLCAIVDASQAVEFISYQNVSLAAGNQYNLTNLRRGQLGSAVAAHIAGALFARIDQSTFEYQFDPSDVGVPLYFKFTSFNTYGNREQSLSSVSPLTLTPAGSGAGAIAAADGTFLPGLDKVPDGTVNYKTIGPNQITNGVIQGRASFGKNLVSNPSFEYNVGGYPTNTLISGTVGQMITDDWQIRTTSPYFQFDLEDSSQAQTGSRNILIRLSQSVSVPNGVSSYADLIGNLISVRAGDTLYMEVQRAWDENALFPAGVTGIVRAGIIYYDKNGTDLAANTGGWQPVSELTSPNNAYALGTGVFTVPVTVGASIPVCFVRPFVQVIITNSSGSAFNTGTSLYMDARFDALLLTYQANIDNELISGTDRTWASLTQKNAAVDANGNLKLKNIGGVPGITSDPALTSTSFVTIPEMTQTITTHGGYVFVNFAGVILVSRSSVTSDSVHWAIFRNGVQISPDFSYSLPGSTSASEDDTINATNVWLDQPAAGTYTYDVRWRTVFNHYTVTSAGTSRTFQCVELT